VRQSRRQSLLEAITNTVVGYAIAVLIQLVVFPLFGLDVPLGNSLAIGAIFTAAPILRSYALRRAFEALRRRQEQA
jgi:CO/xanthine dehydrogenase FAD-binding subunit